MRSLTESFRKVVGREDAPILIDQEGGRVQRLQPPVWSKYPAPAYFEHLVINNQCRNVKEMVQAVALCGRLIADELSELGITINCAPVCDLSSYEDTNGIADRAFGKDNPYRAAAFAQAFAAGLMAGGILPVVKHLPGLGKSEVDSHLKLPAVEETVEQLRDDFYVFRHLNYLPIGMVGHALYRELDEEYPASQSANVLHAIVHTIGFRGILLTDDISMSALSGTLDDRARASISAGCDIVLFGKANVEDARMVAHAVPEIVGLFADRAEKALARRTPAIPFDRKAGIEEFERLTGIKI